MAAKKASVISSNSSIIARIANIPQPAMEEEAAPIQEAAKEEPKKESAAAPKQRMFYMLEEEHRLLKFASAKEGRAMSEILREGLREYAFEKYKAALESAEMWKKASPGVEKPSLRAGSMVSRSYYIDGEDFRKLRMIAAALGIKGASIIREVVCEWLPGKYSTPRPEDIAE